MKLTLVIIINIVLILIKKNNLCVQNTELHECAAF